MVVNEVPEVRFTFAALIRDIEHSAEGGIGGVKRWSFIVHDHVLHHPSFAFEDSLDIEHVLGDGYEVFCVPR